MSESQDKLTLRLTKLLEKDSEQTIKQLAEKLYVNQTLSGPS